LLLDSHLILQHSLRNKKTQIGFCRRQVLRRSNTRSIGAEMAKMTGLGVRDRIQGFLSG
jgi:hypothetical protein